ncbi:MAG: hypothetical protein FWC59_00075 [Actinomycetia bacterium]|nr:hypothetical protein [Actinomycetes bacterium]
MRSTADYNGKRVRGGKTGKRRIGKIRRAVFYPDNFRLAGFIIQRPDFLFMFKRPDRFLAWDSFEEEDGRLVAYGDNASWDRQALKRLGLDWDSAVILQGLSLETADGRVLGQVDSVEFDEKSCLASDLLLTTGLGTKSLLGTLRLPASAVQEIRADEHLILRLNTELPGLEGGLAAKAGEQSAKVGNFVKTRTDAANDAVGRVTEKAGAGLEKLGAKAGQALGRAKRKSEPAGKTAGKTADQTTDQPDSEQSQTTAGSLLASGSQAVGRQIRRSRGMFGDFADEFKKASK